MLTLSLGDFIVIFLINVVVVYVLNFAKRSGELSAEEISGDKEFLKQKIRDAVAQARTVLTELRVHEFQIPTGKRKLARMNSLVEELSRVDNELGTKVWSLVNVPTILETYKKKSDPESEKYYLESRNGYFKDLEWALKRLDELEKDPVGKR